MSAFVAIKFAYLFVKLKHLTIRICKVQMAIYTINMLIAYIYHQSYMLYLKQIHLTYFFWILDCCHML